MHIHSLIVNEQYWTLFSTCIHKTQEFIETIDKDTNLISIPNNELNWNFCITFSRKDKDCNSKYGLDIRANGSSRASRIPIVRFSLSNQCIFKIAKNIDDIEKGIADLNNLEYFLTKSKTDYDLPMPVKLLITLVSASDLFENSFNRIFFEKKCKESNTQIISNEVIRKILFSLDTFDIETLCNSKSKLILEI